MNDTMRSALADLRTRWFGLHDLDRARAVDAIHRTGISLKEIAAALHCSRSLLSHLVRAADAPVADRAEARWGKLSTRALVRRARAAGTRQRSRHREALAFEREQAAFEAARRISEWLAQQGLTAVDSNEVIRMALAMPVTTQWKDPALADVPLKEILDLGKPPLPETKGPRGNGWYARWLHGWTSIWLSDPRTRVRALEVAAAHTTASEPEVP